VTSLTFDDSLDQFTRCKVALLSNIALFMIENIDKSDEKGNLHLTFSLINSAHSSISVCDG